MPYAAQGNRVGSHRRPIVASSSGGGRELRGDHRTATVRDRRELVDDERALEPAIAAVEAGPDLGGTVDGATVVDHEQVTGFEHDRRVGVGDRVAERRERGPGAGVETRRELAV